MPVLLAPKAPNLINAPQAYDARYHDQYSREMRVYFNTLDNALQAVFGPKGGDYLTFSYGSFYDTTDQTAVSTTVAYAITLNTTDISQGVSIASSSQLTFADAGVYNIQFSIQLSNQSNASQDIDIWFRKNGTDIANSNSRFGLAARKGVGDPYHIVAALNFLVTVQALDYIQLMWNTTSVDARIEHYVAGTSPTRPVVPSVILTATRVSDVVSSIYA
jgi:hypothetical protein